MSNLFSRLSVPFAMAFLCWSAAAPAQDNHIIQHYTNENGLPANGIRGMELDKKNGFLWIGTQAGLVRFDGAHFSSFPGSWNLPTNGRIFVLTRNREGAIFCADDNFSVSRIDNFQPVFALADTFFIPPSRPSGARFFSRPVKEVVERLRSLKTSSYLPPRVLFHDEAGDSSSFSFIRSGHGYQYQAAHDTLLDFPGFETVIRINKATYFVRPNLQLYWYSDSLEKLLPVRIHGQPYGDQKGEQGPRLIWTPGMKAPFIIWRQDLWILEGSRDSLQLKPLCSGCCPKNGDITSIQLWEEKGLLFLGSEVNGLYVVRTPFIRSVRAMPGGDAGSAEYAQAEQEPGIITTASGFGFTSQGTLASGKPAFRFTGSNIYRDGQGDYWYSSVDTIVRFHHADGHFTKIPVNDRAAKKVFAEMDHHMYVISELAIIEVTGNRYRKLYKLPDSTHDLKGFITPDAAVEWKPGILAIAGEKLLLWDRKRPASLDTIVIPGLVTKVRALLRYGDYLLIGTYGQGFFMYKNGVVKKMPTDKQQYLSYAHCFMTDDSGFCWISTNHGLFKASLHALVAAYEDDLKEIYYHYFGKDDGILNTEFNGGCQPCALKLSSGLFSFPTMNGMVLLDPHAGPATPPEGQLFIEAVLTDTVSLPATDSVLQNLPGDIRDLRFRLSLSQFSNPENIYFSYMLESYNTEWQAQDITQNSTLHFGGLKPGSYTLRMRVRNGFEPGQARIIACTFQIPAPWYQRWWFYGLCAFGFFAFTWGMVKWRTGQIAKRKQELQDLVAIQTENIEMQTRQLESQLHQLKDQQARLQEDNDIKARLIGIISHDMISPLKFMTYMGKKLRDGYPPSSPSHETASFIINIARELEMLSLNMLSWIRFHHQSVQMQPETFNLHQLLTESVEIASTLAREKDIGLFIDVPPDMEVRQFRQAIGVIVYNIAMNAVKYTREGQVRIEAGYTDGHLSLAITDTGVGMPAGMTERLNNTGDITPDDVPPATKSQFGYVIVKDLLRLVGGGMKVESTLHKGTKVMLSFGKPTVS